MCIPTAVHKYSFFSTSLPTPVVSCVFYFSHSDRCKVISHCSFDLHFPDDEWYWASFHVSVGPLHVFFGEMSLRVFSPCLMGLFAFRVLICMRSLHFGYKPFFGYTICKYLLPLSRLSFTFADCFLRRAEALKFNVVPIVSLCFCFPYLRRHVLKEVAMGDVEELTACVLF